MATGMAVLGRVATAGRGNICVATIGRPASGGVSSMSTASAMTEEMHREERDHYRDQEPILTQKAHTSLLLTAILKGCRTVASR